MPVWELSSATWEEVRSLLDEAGTPPPLALLPVGATEAHGPHLPLATDVVIAKAMARAGAERLSMRGHPVLILPPLAYTAAPFAAGFPGTISLRPETVSALVVDIARSLGSQGVHLLALANAHLDPIHLESLRAAVEEVERTAPHDADPESADQVGSGEPKVTMAFPDLTRRRWAERLTDEFRSGACHAGRFEGSIVLAERAEWVREAVLTGLQPVPESLSQAIREGKRTFEEAGGERAYFGWPADATAEEGRQTIEILGEILEEAVLEALEA